MLKTKLLKKNKNYINILFFIVLWIFAVLNYANVDYENYRLIYEYYIPNGMGLSVMPDIGFYFLCKLGSGIGLSFFAFRGIYITIALVIFVAGIDYICGGNKKIYILYIFFPFCFDIVQFRFFMAVAVVIYALRFLCQGKKGIYIFLVILGATQHASILVYLLFLLTYLDYKQLKRIVFIITVVLTVVFLVTPGLLTRLFGGFFVQLNTYLSSSYDTIYLFGVHLALTLCAIVWNEMMIIKEKNVINIFLDKALLIMLCFTPFIILDDDYMRLYRGTFILLYSCLYKQTQSHRYANLKNIIPICYCALMFYTFLSPRSITNWNYVTEPILSSNYFLELLK